MAKRAKLYSVGLATMVAVLGSAGAAQAKVIYGTPWNDNLVGTSGPDVIYGGLGKDTIKGLGGDDRICGGWGDDVVEGGPGNDYIAGDLGDDELHGAERGVNLAYPHDVPFIQLYTGVADRDVIYGRAGNDRITGGPDHDSLYGGWGNDRMTGISGDGDGLGANVVDCGPGFAGQTYASEPSTGCEIGYWGGF